MRIEVNGVTDNHVWSVMVCGVSDSKHAEAELSTAVMCDDPRHKEAFSMYNNTMTVTRQIQWKEHAAEILYQLDKVEITPSDIGRIETKLWKMYQNLLRRA